MNNGQQIARQIEKLLKAKYRVPETLVRQLINADGTPMIYEEKKE